MAGKFSSSVYIYSYTLFKQQLSRKLFLGPTKLKQVKWTFSGHSVVGPNRSMHVQSIKGQKVKLKRDKFVR